MLPDEYQQACLRTWHKDQIAISIDWEDCRQLERAVEASSAIESLKKRVFHGRIKPFDYENWSAMIGLASEKIAPKQAGQETPQVTAASHGLIGMFGEWHELVIADSQEERISEAGDMLYYLTVWLHEHGISLDQVMAANVAKLKERYPEA